jgi:hypothetical protein
MWGFIARKFGTPKYREHSRLGSLTGKAVRNFGWVPSNVFAYWTTSQAEPPRRPGCFLTPIDELIISALETLIVTSHRVCLFCFLRGVVVVPVSGGHGGQNTGRFPSQGAGEWCHAPLKATSQPGRQAGHVGQYVSSASDKVG